MAKDKHPRGCKLIIDATTRGSYRTALLKIQWVKHENKLHWYRKTDECWKSYRQTQWRDSVCQ